MSNDLETARVVAPMNLEGGFHLDIEKNGITKTVIVPQGGVLKGEAFVGAVASPMKSDVHASLIEIANKGHPPTGKWRDGLCSCCILGLCHPLLWMSYCLGPVVLGQVMTRMRLNCIGSPGSTQNTCSIVTMIWVGFILLSLAYNFFITGKLNKCAQAMNDEGTSDYPNATLPPECLWSPTVLAIYYFMSFLSYIFAIYFIIALCRTRRQLRTKYAIPPSCCEVDALDDCCCSYWCGCCVISQMARHTNDYNEYPVHCCSGDCFNKTGQNLEARKNYAVQEYEVVGMNEIV